MKLSAKLEDGPWALKISLILICGVLAAAFAALSLYTAWHAVAMLVAFDKEAMGLMFGTIMLAPAYVGAVFARELIAFTKRLFRAL